MLTSTFSTVTPAKIRSKKNIMTRQFLAHASRSCQTHINKFLNIVSLKLVSNLSPVIPFFFFFFKNRFKRKYQINLRCFRNWLRKCCLDDPSLHTRLNYPINLYAEDTSVYIFFCFFLFFFQSQEFLGGQ